MANQIVKNCDLDDNGVIDYWDFLVAIVHTKNKEDVINYCKRAYDLFFKDKYGNLVSNNEFVDILCEH